MRKSSKKKGKPALVLRGKPGAAKFVNVTVSVIKKAMADKRIEYILDDSGKALFTEPMLRAFQRIYVPGTRNKRTYYANRLKHNGKA